MATTQKNRITLKGSTHIVTEFFEYSLNSILFQRGLYPPEDFRMTKKYGLNMLMTTDIALQGYLQRFTSCLSKWLESGAIQRIVMAITSTETGHVMERWQFDIHIVDPTSDSSPQEKPKGEEDVNKEIQAIIRQITASITFLPMLDSDCSFNLLAYTNKDTEVPMGWVDSDPHLIQKNAEQVRLRSFSTQVHKVDALVSYRLDQDY
ncbi:MAG: DNA-binding protein [Piptocephalis tieghemiana]|nr:MAG: DNA-binding protein [Piptocephalis tieghemiana]